MALIFQGKLEDGTEFDSSIPRGQPLQFTLGSGQVIKGWDQGLLGWVFICSCPIVSARLWSFFFGGSKKFIFGQKMPFRISRTFRVSFIFTCPIVSAQLWGFYFEGSKLIRFSDENAFSKLLLNLAKSSKDGIKDF